MITKNTIIRCDLCGKFVPFSEYYFINPISEYYTWIDEYNSTLDYDSPTISKWHKKPEYIDRLKCEKCGSTLFEVLYTDDYETTAHCVQCGLYKATFTQNVVHSG